GEQDDIGLAGGDAARELGVVHRAGGGVEGREIDVGVGDGEALRDEPGAVARVLVGGGHDPEDGAGGLELGAFEHGAQKQQAGVARQAFAGEQPPEQHHETGVGDGEVGGGKGGAVGGRLHQIDGEAGGGGRDDESAGEGVRDGRVERADMEIDAEHPAHRRGGGGGRGGRGGGRGVHSGALGFGPAGDEHPADAPGGEDGGVVHLEINPAVDHDHEQTGEGEQDHGPAI